MPISKKSYEILKFISTGNKTQKDVSEHFKINLAKDEAFLKLDSLLALIYKAGGNLELSDTGFAIMEEYEKQDKVICYSKVTAISTSLACVIAAASFFFQSCKSCP